MQGSDYLLTCAEVAAALAGFSALVVAISDRDDPDVAAWSRGLVGSLIERSLFAVFFSLVPVLLAGLEVAPPHLWLLCSGGLATYIFSLAWRSYGLRSQDRMFRELVAAPAFTTTMVLGVFVLALQVAHAIGIGLHQSVWWYLVGVTWLLVSVAYMFYFGIRRWVRAA